jgi:hypothetical protein
VPAQGEAPGGQVGNPSSVPIPDPTSLTTDAVNKLDVELRRDLASLERLLVQRLDTIELDQRDNRDEAQNRLAEAVALLTTQISEKMHAEREYIAGQISLVAIGAQEKFIAIEGTFASNALALTAALAAQKEAAFEAKKSSDLAIDKSEAATKEKIDSNAAQTNTSLKALEDRFDDLKERVDRGDGNTAGAHESRSEQRLNTNQLISLASVIIIAIALVVTVLHNSG